jgi:hypothetical protein
MQLDNYTITKKAKISNKQFAPSLSTSSSSRPFITGLRTRSRSHGHIPGLGMPVSFPYWRWRSGHLLIQLLVEAHTLKPNEFHLGDTTLHQPICISFSQWGPLSLRIYQDSSKKRWFLLSNVKAYPQGSNTKRTIWKSLFKDS